MGLRTQQSAQVLEMYQDNLSATEIADKLHVGIADVELFIPKGDLLIAYQKVRKARLSEAIARTMLDGLVDAAADLQSNKDRCNTAVTEMTAAVKEATAELKAMKATLRSLKEHVTGIEQSIEISPIAYANDGLDKAVSHLDAAEDALEAAKATDAAKRKKEADRVARKAKAEQLAEQALIAAAMSAAKSVVAESIDKRLEREENQDDK